MRTRLLLALLLTATPAFAAPPATPAPNSAPLALTLEVVPEQPRPGQPIFWLGKLRNVTRRTLYVPAHTAEWLHFYAEHRKPMTGGASGHGYRFGPQPTPLAWRPLPPGATLELAGALGDDVPECRHGCPIGDVSMTLELAVPTNLVAEPPDADHIVPHTLRAGAGLHIHAPTYPLLERTAADTVALSVLRTHTVKGEVRVRLRLENRTNTPLWVPRPAHWQATCVLTETAPGGWGMPGSRLSESPPPLRLQQAVLVQPGQAVDGEVACPGWAMPRQGTVAVTLAAPQWADARKPPRVPWVWSGVAETGVVETTPQIP